MKPVFGPLRHRSQTLDPGSTPADEWIVKALDSETPRRARRAKAYAWSAAGLTTALLLIGGSLAALNGAVLGGGAWSTYDDGGDSQAIILAPRGDSAGTGGVRGPVDVLAAPEEPGASVVAPPAADSTVSVGVAAQGRQAGASVAPSEGSSLRVEVESQPRPSAPRTTTAPNTFRVSADADSDGLSDRTETRLGIDPKRSDTDGDELPDGWEVRHGLNPGDQIDARNDVDGDGLWNRTEYRVHSNPRSLDTDGNGRSDGLDDTDGDHVPNAIEQGLPGLDPTSADSNSDGKADGEDDGDGDGLPNATEVGLGTDPGTQDSDGDGQSDGTADTDGDGVPNGREVSMGLDPTTPDSNGDGQTDGVDDSDGDGRSNAEESAQGDDPGTAQSPVSEPAP
jgi:hypothetical protein